MSSRPIKKKPLSKSTIHLLESLRRKRECRKLAKRFLIVCEDNVSAPQYFEALRKYRSFEASKVVVVPSGHRTQPQQVVNLAKKQIAVSKNEESGTTPFEQVWCIIDGDYGNKIKNARRSANAATVQLAVTTPCFEYWILLHHGETSQPFPDCDSVTKFMKEELNLSYDKSGFDFSETLKGLSSACERAKRLRRSSDPEDQNPCSDIYLLINSLDESVECV